jgi:hypothetical protein
VLKSILSGVRGNGDAEDREGRGPSGQRPDLARLKMLMEYFPIGKKLRYVPEFKEEIVFDTILVGYGINGDFVYSWDAVELQPDGTPTGFRVGEAGKRVAVGTLRDFRLLVPDTSELEMSLDYYRRAMIGRGRQFNKGNNISLISNAGARGVSTVDTEVVKQIVMPDGPYAQARMVLLEPDLRTMSVTDQRTKTRARTCVPVVVTVGGGRLRGPCTVVDISDAAMRIRVREGEVMPPMTRGEEAMLDLDFGEAQRNCSLRGVVIRRSSEACVVSLEAQLKDGRFVKLSALDILELKAGLLNYGK